MDYKFKNDEGDILYREYNGQDDNEFDSYYDWTDGERWKKYYGSHSTKFFIDKVEVVLFESLIITEGNFGNSGKDITKAYISITYPDGAYSIISPSNPHTKIKLEDVIEGIVAYIYARNNCVTVASNGKTKEELKELSFKELSEIEKKSNDIENTFSEALKNAADGKQVDFQGLLDETFGKGACDLEQRTKACIDKELDRIKEERLAREKEQQEMRERLAAEQKAWEEKQAAKRAKIDKFKEGITKLTTPLRLGIKAVNNAVNSVVKGVCNMVAQAKEEKEAKKLEQIEVEKREALLNQLMNGMNDSELDSGD